MIVPTVISTERDGSGRFVKGYSQSPETRKRTSEIAKHLGFGKWMVGKKHTEQTRLKMSAQRQGENAYNWKGGRRKSERGYILIYAPGHPYASSNGIVREHRLVMEKRLGRYLHPGEVVHHINGTRDDNRAENLMLFASHKEHITFESI